MVSALDPAAYPDLVSVLTLEVRQWLIIGRRCAAVRAVGIFGRGRESGVRTCELGPCVAAGGCSSSGGVLFAVEGVPGTRGRHRIFLEEGIR